MPILLRKSDVLPFFGNNQAAVARDFDPQISRIAVHRWPDLVPELRARQLLDRHPELRDYVLDPVTGLNAVETRERLQAT